MKNRSKERIRTLYVRQKQAGYEDEVETPQPQAAAVLIDETAECQEVPCAEAADDNIEGSGGVCYRVMKNGDLEAASAFVRSVFVMFVGKLFKPEGRAEFFNYIAPEQFKKRMSDNYTYLAIHKGDIIGLINAADYKHISLFYVSFHEQRKGIGRMLLEFVEKRALKRGCTEITVHASSNSLIACQKLGFVPEGGETRERGMKYFCMKKVISPSSVKE